MKTLYKFIVLIAVLTFGCSAGVYASTDDADEESQVDMVYAGERLGFIY